MDHWLRDLRNGRGVALVLLALVLAVRIVLPTGFMPLRAPDGIVITVCTGMGQAKAFLPIERDDGSDRPAAAEQPCVFATGLGDLFGMPHPIATISAPAPLPTRLASSAIPDLTVHRLAAPPPPAQGPPARG